MKLLRLALPTTMLLLTCALNAQYNSKGKFHIAIGGAFGAHGTEYKYTTTLFNLNGVAYQYGETTTDGAATATLPIELGYGLSDRFSLGLYVERGSYLDSNNTNTNQLGLAGLQPRFYLMNKDRFAWMASLQLGIAAMRWQHTENGVTDDARFLGSQFGLGTGIGYNFTDHFGLQFHVRYVTTNMELKQREIGGHSITDWYSATLRTGGVIGQLSLAFNFGGN